MGESSHPCGAPVFKTISFSYLGIIEGTGKGFSGDTIGACCFSVDSKPIGTGVSRLKAVSIFSTKSNCPPLPLSAIKRKIASLNPEM